MPLPLEQCRAAVDSLELNYPLYANPDWSVFEAYGTGHVLYAPKQTWIGIDGDGVVRWTWHIGDEGRLRRVPLAIEALDQFSAALTTQ